MPINKLTLLLIIFSIYLLMQACASTKTSANTSEPYAEDVSMLKPTFNPLPPIESLPVVKVEEKKYISAQQAVNFQLKQIQDSIDYFYVGRKYIDGYTIQVYVGQKREEAMLAKKSLDMNLPELKAEMLFSQPTFRVKAGKYFSALDAQKDYVNIKRIFPNAILVPDKLPVQ